eukprot:2172654-Pyramimonas_sp.AAC.1
MSYNTRIPFSSQPFFHPRDPLNTIRLTRVAVAVAVVQEELMRERDILNKLKTQAENATQRQMDLVKINENTKKNLEQEIQGYK